MYRIVCESYQNYINSFDEENSRLEISRPIELILNVDKYKKEQQKQSELYKKICDLVYFMEKNVDKFPRIKAFLWTLKSRNIEGREYNVSNKEELEEQTKLINSFLKLAYWY